MLREEAGIKEFLDHNKRPEERFKALAKLDEGKITTWSDILNTYLFDLNVEGDQKQDYQNFVGQLIQDRDLLDQECYREAIARLFDDDNKSYGSQQYNYNWVWNKNTGVNNDLTGYKLVYHEVHVNSKDARHNNLLEVAIKAPGSRDLMSDVDTTIEVTHCDERLRQKIRWPAHFEGSEGCLKTLLQAAIVHNFNQINLEITGLTGALSRDSNAYAKEGYFKNDQEQFKFKEKFLSESTLELLKDRALYEQVADAFAKSIVSQYKQKKETQELAASLFSIREYFGEDERGWQREMLDYFETHPLYNDDQGNNNSFRAVIEAALNLTSEWYKFYKNALNELRNGDSQEAVRYRLGYGDKVGTNLEQSSSAEREEDMRIDMKGYLYTKILAKEVACLQSQLDKVDLSSAKRSIEVLAKELKTLENKLKEGKRELRRASTDFLKEAVERHIIFLRNERVSLYRDYEKAIKGYAGAIQEQCDLKNKLQEATIKAGLFAHEAYVNFSALYHTVYWQQSQDDRLRIDRRHIVLCSVLQQIGFRLLHGKDYQDAMQLQDNVYQKALRGGEMLYRVAKYEQRVADMFLGDDTWFGDKFFDNNSGYVLKRLKEPVEKTAFSPNFYRLLNRGILLVKDVKKNKNVPPEQKARKALLESFRRYLIDYLGQDYHQNTDISQLEAIFRGTKEQEGFIKWLTIHDNDLLLDGAKKLITATFKAKLNHKSEMSANDRVLLWGYPFTSRREASTIERSSRRYRP